MHKLANWFRDYVVSLGFVSLCTEVRLGFVMYPSGCFATSPKRRPSIQDRRAYVFILILPNLFPKSGKWSKRIHHSSNVSLETSDVENNSGVGDTVLLVSTKLQRYHLHKSSHQDKACT